MLLVPTLINSILTFTYRFDGLDTSDNMEMYVNGVPRPDDEKYDAQPFANTGDYHGMFSLGRMFVDDIHPLQMGNVMIDELIIWQRVLPYCDVIRLYNAYVPER